MRESDVQKLILDWLALHKIFHWRNNTGAMFGEHKGKRWAVRFGRPGAPDIFLIIRNAYGAEIHAIEVKGPKGKQSEAQKKYQEDFEKAGGYYWLAYSLDDVLKELGAP